MKEETALELLKIAAQLALGNADPQTRTTANMLFCNTLAIVEKEFHRLSATQQNP